MKPTLIVEYSGNKSPGDTSDQMTAYYSPLKETIKWYRKLLFMHRFCIKKKQFNFTFTLYKVADFIFM